VQTIIGNQLLQYQIFGQKNKNTILILHGWEHNSNTWVNLAQSLSSKYKVVLLDLPGFGDSSTPTTTLGIPEYTQTVKGFIQKTGLKSFSLIGHSLGGKIAISLCSQPTVVKKLILISSSGIEQKSLLTKPKIAIFKALKPILQISPHSLQNYLFNKIASPDYREASPQMRPTFKKIISQNVSSLAAKIHIPTIIIWGDQDKELPVKYAKKLRQLIKNSIVRIVWKTGHSPHLENPQKLLTLLNEYL